LTELLKKEVLEPLNEHIKHFPIVMAMVKKRKRKLQDVQAYRRQVLQLGKTAKTKNSEKYNHKKEKLGRAEAIFAKINNDLLEVLERYACSFKYTHASAILPIVHII